MKYTGVNIGNEEYPLVGIHGERIGELENRKIILYDSSLKYAVDEELNLFKIYY